MIRADAIWLATEPTDMRAGIDSLLARVIQVFGQAQPHHAYLFTNARATRIKLLAHDGQGIWLACRRLNQGHFKWPAPGAPSRSIAPNSMPSCGACPGSNWPMAASFAWSDAWQYGESTIAALASGGHHFTHARHPRSCPT